MLSTPATDVGVLAFRRSRGAVRVLAGTAGDFPRGTRVVGNIIRNGGVWAKNYLGGSIFQALAAESVITDNVGALGMNG